MAAMTSASGRADPATEAVRGSIEQNVIFHLMLQAQPDMREAVVRKRAAANTACRSRLPTEASLRKAKPAQAR